MLERAVEGTSSRVFRARLQPVQLAKAASRAMQERQVVGLEGPEVPNRYRIALHPADYEQFAEYRLSLQTQIEGYLARFASDRGLRPVAAWRVELVADEDVSPHAIRVDARMADVDGAGAQTVGEVHELIEGTALLRPTTAKPGLVDAELVAEDGRRVPLKASVTTLGRALDNDVVIADSRVSRYHAEIRRDPRGLSVHDLGSTNGITVDGKRVTEQRLGPATEVSLGGFRLVVRALPDTGSAP